MMKRNWKLFILTALITLLPIVAGLLLWDALPEEIATHWNMAGEADGWSPKGFAVIGLPLILTGIHLICSFATFIDPNSTRISQKMLGIVLWICPVISLLGSGYVLATALGHTQDFPTGTVVSLLLGGLFLYIGNYLPKCTQNYTIGIKLPWTLADEANWNATHRFGGWVWTIGGVVILGTCLWSSVFLTIGTLAVMALAPTVYSFVYYLRHRNG